jgi:hypothetical protein
MLALLSAGGIRLRIVAQGFRHDDKLPRITDKWPSKASNSYREVPQKSQTEYA